MQLERIALKLRRRNTWEALDLGQAMLRAGAGPLYRAWCLTFGLAGIVLFALCWQLPWLAILLLWWIKPLCDRAMLLALSRSIFGQQMGWRELWRALPGLLRGPGVVSGLTLRRLSLARSFLLPVWQLEQQAGPAGRARMRVLAQRNRGAATWLTFVCANMVSVLYLGLIGLVLVMLPAGMEDMIEWKGFFDTDNAALHIALLSHGLWMAAEAIIEPLYVASGFALYLNRRSELEGWDIDVGFRRLNERRSALTQTARALGSLAALALCLALLLPAPAATAAPAAPEPGSPKAVITEVLRDPVFGSEVKDTTWQLRDFGDKEEKDKPRPAWLETLRQIVEAIAKFGRVLVWIGGALLLAGLIYLLIRYCEHWLPGQRHLAHAPEFLFGLDVRPDSLPDDVAAAARAEIAAGRIEAALSLLYRATLVALIHRLHVEFRVGDTEDDCLQRVDRKLDAPAHGHFAALLNAWRAAAYAHRLPDATACESLCSDWERYFGRRRPA